MRKCSVCNGKGVIWGTPPLVNTDSKGPVEHPDRPNLNDLRDNDQSYGLSVMCWRCVGKGLVQDSYPNDSGEEL